MNAHRIMVVASAMNLALAFGASPALAGNNVVMDFEILAEAGIGSVLVGETYSEDGYTLNEIGTDSSKSFESFRLDNSLFAGSTGLFNNEINSTIELVKDGGGGFRLASIDLAPLLFPAKGLETSVTFTGELDGNPVAIQTFTTSVAQPFETFVFNAGFANVDRVTWIQTNNVGTTDFHQFDDIVLGDATATILESATLGPTGLVTGLLLSNQFPGARFSLSEPARITEIGGHIKVTSGSIWGAIIRLSGPGALPPSGFDVEANALASTLFEFTDGLSADLCQPVDAFLSPGDYALVFGGDGLFGSTGTGTMPTNNTDTQQADYFFRSVGGTWADNSNINRVRFVVRGTPLPCISCDGDADRDLIVDFGDVNSVLGHWLNVCLATEPVYESATLEATGQGGGPSLGLGQFLGVRFSLTELTRITRIGGHLSTDGTIWGAIIPLSAPGALPADGIDMEAAALASALFGPTAGNLSEDLLEPVDVTLGPGIYALVFGADGLFGSTSSGAMPGNNTEIGTPEYFFASAGPVWQNGGFVAVRFVVEGDALCSTCDGDADGSGVVNFEDVNAVLGNWLAVCP